MKKISIFIIIIIVCCLHGCGQKKTFEYSGDNADLYTEAIYSTLGSTGIERTVYGSRDPIRLEIVEEDQFGRKMFLYAEYGSMGRYQEFMLISQKTQDGFVQYYPDYNFVIGEFQGQDETVSKDETNEKQPYWKNVFTENQVMELKVANDWDREINIEKCIKQKVVRKKEDPLTKKEKNALYNELFNDSRNDREVYIKYVTMDDEGKLLLLASNIDSSLMDYRMVIIDGDSHYNQKIDDVMAYQEQLAIFKREHNWKKS